MYTYMTHGTCCRAFQVELDGDVVKEVKYMGGCDGNLKAICKIAQGMTVDQLAAAWEGNRCGMKPTSCADQLVKALREAQAATA
ncbi:MAG: TIGR03905 family TSCPD domain-containing protein [Eggerthellales bacterium]|nr:TIGR03905 family TSCPD domain-containing protein [Eggerthellales bacterium]